MIKKRSAFALISVFGVVISSVAVAGSAAASTDNDSFAITVPHLKSGFNISAAAVWLTPGASNLNFAINNKALPLLQPSWSEKELTPDYSPAFEIGMGYVFANGGKDVKLNWLHLDSDTANGATSAPNSNYFVGPDYDIGPDGSRMQNATGAAQFKADLINLDFGQHVDFGQHLDVRFFGGLNTGFLTENLTDVYSGNATANAASGSIPATIAGPFSVTQYERSRYSGAGPRLGMDATYRMHCGFGFIGEGAASALMGTMASNTSYLGTSQTLINNGYAVPNPQYISDQHVFQVVPGFDAKLGVDYKHAFHSGTELVVSTGYQAAVYINAISQYLPGSLVQTKGLSTGSVYVESMNHVLSNYSIQGPFLKLALQF